MQPKSVWEYIELGIGMGQYQYVQHFGMPDESNTDAEDTLTLISPDELTGKFERLGLLGARGIVRAMQGEHENPRIPFYFVDALLAVVQSESERIQAFFPSDTRWDTQKLLHNVSALFAPNVFAFLHDVAQYDFSEAGKCIVFELPTSAAFHLMRGTEMVLRQTYSAITGKAGNKMFWGTIVSELKNNETKAIPKTLYDHLNNIKDNFRNPTQHPDKIYSIHEAQDLFGVCIDVVDQMVLVMNQLNATNAE